MVMLLRKSPTIQDVPNGPIWTSPHIFQVELFDTGLIYSVSQMTKMSNIKYIRVKIKMERNKYRDGVQVIIQLYVQPDKHNIISYYPSINGFVTSWLE